MQYKMLDRTTLTKYRVCISCLDGKEFNKLYIICCTIVQRFKKMDII